GCSHFFLSQGGFQFDGKQAPQAKRAGMDWSSGKTDYAGPASEPVEPRRVVVQQLAPIGARKFRGHALEISKHAVKRDPQSVHREVGGEHAALDAKDLDRFEDDPPVVLIVPGAGLQAQAGKLAADLLAGG